MPNFDNIDLTDVIMDGDPYGNFEDPGGGGGGSGEGIAYGTCATAAATAAKVVTLTDASGWELKQGAIVAVKFSNTNTFSATAQAPVTLNVNNTGAKNIYWGNSGNPTGTNTTAFGRANYVNTYVYDGTYWVWVGSSADNNTTYSNMSKSELTTGTATTSRVVRADYLKSAILDLANPVGTVIESTTCNTMAKVVAAYGGTTWIQHTGYMLRGASSGVTANHTGNDGGADSVTVSSVASHNHGGSTTNSGAHEHFVGSPSNHSWAARYSSGNLLSTFAFAPTAVNQAGNYGDNTMYAHSNNIRNSAHTHGINSAGSNYTVNTIPKYKNVYIWERIS